jgi:hypothetical protein
MIPHLVLIVLLVLAGLALVCGGVFVLVGGGAAMVVGGLGCLLVARSIARGGLNHHG